MMRAIFGGSFDPVHHGHIAVARRLRDAGAEVSLLISVNPPFRTAAHASAQDRLAMLRLAFETDRDISLLRGDEVCESPYTIDVLRRVRSCLGDESSLAWAMGSDQYAHLNRWRDWRRLTDYAHLVVFPRKGTSAEPHPDVPIQLDGCDCRFEELFAERNGRVAKLSCSLPEVSSSEIRDRLKRGGGIAESVPGSVLDFIEARGLYGTTAG